MPLELLQSAYSYVDVRKSSDISIKLDNDFYLLLFSKASFNLNVVLRPAVICKHVPSSRQILSRILCA
jgi:hypothetical protein